MEPLRRPLPTQAERHRALAERRTFIQDMLDGHARIQAALLQGEGAHTLVDAREWIECCRRHQSCAEHFLDAWEAILDRPDHLFEMIEAGQSEYLVQASPFRGVIERGWAGALP